MTRTHPIVQCFSQICVYFILKVRYCNIKCEYVAYVNENNTSCSKQKEVSRHIGRCKGRPKLHFNQ